MIDAEPITISVDDDTRVSGVLQVPDDARACYLMAHGAGAGMNHSFMTSVAHELAERGIATLRYQFPNMEQGARRPGAPKVAQATVRAAAAEAARLLPDLHLFAGGKSYGGRMTSQAQALEPLPSVRGLVFLGFPLHAPKKPSDQRAKHLSDVRIPMLFLQGDRDSLADLTLLQPLIERLGGSAKLRLFEQADHSFHVPKRSGRTDSEVRREMLEAMAAWIERLG